MAAGRKAVPYLKPALNDSDLEISRRSRSCLKEIEEKPETSLVLAAAGLVAAPSRPERRRCCWPTHRLRKNRKRKRRCSRRCKWCPCVPVRSTQRCGRPSRPARRERAAAAWVLGRLPKTEERDLVLPLLADPEAVVRFRAAEALVMSRDRRGLPVLVGLLKTGTMELALEAEALLVTVAGEGEKVPAVPLGLDGAERSKCHQAWLIWWRDHGAKLDLARLDLEQRVAGLRLVAANSGYGGNGAVWEYGPEHKNRWLLRNVGGPFDARVLPGGRILLAEYNSRKVSERNREGKILWEYTPKNAPLEVQRLANGNTLIATNHEILEVTRTRRSSSLSTIVAATSSPPRSWPMDTFSMACTAASSSRWIAPARR